MKCRGDDAPREARREKCEVISPRSAAENFLKVCTFRLPFLKSFQTFPTVQQNI